MIGVEGLPARNIAYVSRWGFTIWLSTGEVIYRSENQGISTPEFWVWFDLMPCEVRDAINDARSMKECVWLWNAAIKEFGEGIKKALNKTT